MTDKKEMTVQILAGLCANPSIIQPCSQIGFRLANCSWEQLVKHAFDLANLVESEYE